MSKFTHILGLVLGHLLEINAPKTLKNCQKCEILSNLNTLTVYYFLDWIKEAITRGSWELEEVLSTVTKQV